MIVKNLYKDGKARALTFSYDDGRCFDRRLTDILNAHGMKGSFHLNSGNMSRGDDRWVSVGDIADVYRGHEVSVHTVHHPMIARVSKEDMIREVMEDRRTLENACGYPVRGMSYPYGSCSEELAQVLRVCGVVCSRTTAATNGFGLPADWLFWHPTCHHSGKPLEKLDAFVKARDLPLFYIWGHSYELPDDYAGAFHWKDLEEFCAEAEKIEDCWFATNIEIYDYVQALDALVVSADGSMAYNPAATAVWVTMNGRPTEILPGQVVRGE